MDPKTAELVAELPEDLQGPATRERELADLLATLAHKPVPTNRVLRMWCLGTLQARIAAAYMVHWIRRGFAGQEEKERLRNEVQLKAAVRLLGSMGYMRGAVLKVGQVLGNYPQMVSADFADLLKSLHFEAPPMHFSLLREQVRNELGGDPEDLYASFDTEAFAAASLGQVHRARLKSGEEVAVKIQYPNIARTIRADFANLRAFLQPMRFTKDWGNTMDQAAEIEATLLRETDYGQELENAEKVRRSLRDLDDVIVPRMYPGLSSPHVLTMDFVPGPHVDAYMKTNPRQELRDRHGSLVVRVISRLFHADHAFLADPNPGNYMFLSDGRLGMVDFGCLRTATPEEWEIFELGIRGYREGGAMLREAIQASTLLSDEEMEDEERYRMSEASCDWFWEAMREDAPFDFGDEDYLRRGLEHMGLLIKRRYTRSLPVLTWMNRTFYGVRALLYLLRARVNLHRIDAEEAARAGN
jgi:hypothetical protein